MKLGASGSIQSQRTELPRRDRGEYSAPFGIFRGRPIAKRGGSNGSISFHSASVKSLA